MRLRAREALVVVACVFCTFARGAERLDMYDHSLLEFPRGAGEADDTARIQRAFDGTGGGVLYLPRGDYSVSSTLVISNRCSLKMHKSAKIKAVAPMNFVLRVKNSCGNIWDNLDFLNFIEGGVIDGNGMASCLAMDEYWRHNLDNIKFFNGKPYGLYVASGGAELVANGLYFVCRLHGLAGNTAMCLQGGDSHYNDIFILDYTTGVSVKGPSNRLTRVHVWGGSLPPVKKGDLPEMLENSTSFRIEGHSTILRDCYADTGKIGFDVHNAWEVRILGCSFFNNADYGLNDLTIVRQTGDSGALLVSDCAFTRSGPKERNTVYEGNGNVKWRDIIYAGNWSGVTLPDRRPDEDKAGSSKLNSPNTKLAGD